MVRIRIRPDIPPGLHGSTVPCSSVIIEPVEGKVQGSDRPVQGAVSPGHETFPPLRVIIRNESHRTLGNIFIGIQHVAGKYKQPVREVEQILDSEGNIQDGYLNGLHVLLHDQVRLFQLGGRQAFHRTVDPLLGEIVLRGDDGGKK